MKWSERYRATIHGAALEKNGHIIQKQQEKSVVQDHPEFLGLLRGKNCSVVQLGRYVGSEAPGNGRAPFYPDIVEWISFKQTPICPSIWKSNRCW